MAANHTRRAYPASPALHSPLGNQLSTSAFPASSPLDMLAIGQASQDDAAMANKVTVQPRGALLERAVKVSRTASVRRGPGSAATSSGQAASSSLSSEQADRQQLVRDMRAARLNSQGRSMSEQTLTPLDESPSHLRSSSPSSSDDGGVDDDEQGENLLGNAFRDSMASDISFNTITGQMEEPLADDRIAEALRGLSLRRRQSIDTVRSSEFGEGGKWDRAWGGGDDDDDYDDYDNYDDGGDDMEVIDEGGRGQQGGNRRRTTIKRSGNKHGVASMAMSDIDVEGMGATGLYAMTKQGSSSPGSGYGHEQSSERSRRQTLSPSSHGQGRAPHELQLHDVPDKEHVVSLTDSRIHASSDRNNHSAQSKYPSNTAKPAAPPGAHDELLAGLGLEPGLSRRDTLHSMMGDIGNGDDYADDDGDENLDGTEAQRRLSRQTHTRSDSTSTIHAPTTEAGMASGTGRHQAKESYSSQSSSGSRNNAHVYVWPPTPQGGSIAGSIRGSSDLDRRDTLRANSHAMHAGQRAVVEYANAAAEQESSSSSSSISSPPHVLSPSKALSKPLDQPILGPDGHSTVRHRGAGHPTGRAPPPAPDLDYGLASGGISGGSGYSNPNEPRSPESARGGMPGLPEIGRNRRRAIEQHDGRESLVSDLDVETLRLDGSSGSDSWERDSRRGSNSTLGTISSAKVRMMRSERDRKEQQRNSIDSFVTIREGSDTHWQEAQAQQLQQPQQSRRPISHPSPMTEKGDPLATLAHPPPPRRSNTADHAPQPLQSNNSPRPPPSKSILSPRQQNTPLSPTFGQQQAQRGAGAQSLRSMASPSLMAKDDLQQRSRSGSGTLATAGRASNGHQGAAAATSQAEAFLTLGINHHESGDLSRSAYYFERSAKVDGGCVVGMCMWGMALREGWGARKDPRKGFEWISKAAARAGELMKPTNSAGSGQAQRSEAELKAIRSELKLSVYELGKCFCYGWGVKMDKLMALEYFELAAKLGDSDAQAEAGALLAAGKGGCKKDLKKAAMYYRMAEAQGYDTVGLSWIHKDKYK